MLTIFFALLGAQAAVASSPPLSSASVGVVDDPCAKLPPTPEVVTEYLAEASAAKAANRAPPQPSASGLAIYFEWQDRLRAADFPALCRYRAANRALPAATRERVVFFGDSITEAWIGQRPAFFVGDRLDRGISGQTTQQMVIRFRADVIDLKPRVVHILAGTNDLAGNTGPTTLAAVEDNIRTMVDLARLHGIHVVIGTLLPAKRYSWRPEIDPLPQIRAFNAWLTAYAAREKIRLVDYYSALDDGTGGMARADSEDGVHPTAAGYARMEPLADRALAVARR